MNDVRYSEMRFLQTLASGVGELQKFYDQNGERSRAIGLSPNMYIDMALTLVEELDVQIQDQNMQLLVARLRGELSPAYPNPSHMSVHAWNHPRETLRSALSGYPHVQTLHLTYRGLRRIEELRDILKRDRILEPFGVLLDARYIHPDLEDALRRSTDTSVSVLYADMDNFKTINDNFSHAAGDVVMKSYFEVVRDSINSFGTGYRFGGDEVVAILVGVDHKRAIRIAEEIRKGVEAMECEHKGKRLPKVTASIGVATTPPESRSADIESIAEGRNRQAKAAGRNRVIAAPQGAK